MFRIGEFARLTRVSVKMLRHYDEIGLFQPARVDVDSGYRFYASDQLPRLNRIIALKDLGFGLERIRTLLDGDLTIDQIRGMLKAQRAEAQAVIESEAQRMRAIEARLDRIEREETLPTHDVVLRAVRPILAACIRQRTDPHGVSALFEELEAYCARHAARAVAPPLSIDYSDDPGEAEHDIEVLVPITTPIPGSNRVDIRTLEGHPSMACVVYGGSYAGDQAARESLLTWIEFNGYRMDGPSREVYLRFGADLEGYELPDAYLAASAGELVVEQNADFPDELARQLADATGTVFDSPAGRTWVRLRTLLLDRYAENGGAPADLRPVFVAVTLATLPELPERTDLAARLALAVAGVLERPVEHIHVFFEPSAAGRIAFGGNLVAE